MKLRPNPVSKFGPADIGELVTIQLLKKRSVKEDEVEIRSKWTGRLVAFWNAYPEMGIKLEGLDVFTVIDRSDYLEFYVYTEEE